jgi:hypothetical protein
MYDDSFFIESTYYFILHRSVQMAFSIPLQHHSSKVSRYSFNHLTKCPSFSAIQSYAPNTALYYYLP